MSYEANTEKPASGCPFAHAPRTTEAPVGPGRFWPDRLDLRMLDRGTAASPLGDDFDYAEALKGLDVDALERDLIDVMTTSQDWWPADFGHYGPFFIRLSWHAAGTYRIHDGRGGAATGAIRFAPHSSWPDNANLDKARRLLWPLKQKYGGSLSWADLIVLAGTVALKDMGLPLFGFAFGREDAWQPDEYTWWGPEEDWLGNERYHGERILERPLGAVQMGLIYVNPEGPDGEPDPVKAAHDIRETFGRMAMNDEETVALIAGGHTFGKAHGAAPESHLGREPEGAELHAQNLGWPSSFGTGAGPDTITSGLEGAWTTHPTRWDSGYFDHLFGYTWTRTKSPAGGWQWTPEEPEAQQTVPDAHDPDKREAPMMFTTDVALREDPAYRAISERFHKHPEQFADAFARAWYKLTHRDMGPPSRFLGPWVPDETPVWTDPVPPVDHPLVDEAAIAALKDRIRAADVGGPALLRAAWGAAATYRDTDKRGGANGGRIRLAPQKDWPVNEPGQLADVLSTLAGVQAAFHDSRDDGVRISTADLIVLGGCVAVEDAARLAGHAITVPFTPGRTDATEEQTDAVSFEVLEPTADGFRNHLQGEHAQTPEALLLDQAARLTLSAPEMTALVGGMRVIGGNVGDAAHGVLTERPGQLTADFFRTLLDPALRWTPSETEDGVFHGHRPGDDTVRWTGTRVDLVFGSHAQLRAIGEVFAAHDGEEAFVRAFVDAWARVMDLDRFELR